MHVGSLGNKLQEEEKRARMGMLCGYTTKYCIIGNRFLSVGPIYLSIDMNCMSKKAIGEWRKMEKPILSQKWTSENGS